MVCLLRLGTCWTISAARMDGWAINREDADRLPVASARTQHRVLEPSGDKPFPPLCQAGFTHASDLNNLSRLWVRHTSCHLA